MAVAIQSAIIGFAAIGFLAYLLSQKAEGFMNKSFAYAVVILQAFFILVALWLEDNGNGFGSWIQWDFYTLLIFVGVFFLIKVFDHMLFMADVSGGSSESNKWGGGGGKW